MSQDSSRAIAMAKRVLSIEAAAITALAERIGPEFHRAVELVLASRGRVIVSGIGKSGHVARKIAATMASTGTPAYFVHAAEAVHGDLGMITHEDVVIAISNSGENDELLTIVPLIKRQGGRLIAITGNAASSLAQEADVHLDARVREEACPLNLAPTASTTAALALGDALAVALFDARGFGTEDFARSHPGGALGRRLLTHVADVMRASEEVPCVGEQLGKDGRGRHRQETAERDAGGPREPECHGECHRQCHGDGDLRHAESEDDALHGVQARQRKLETDGEHQEDDAKLGKLTRALVFRQQRERVGPGNRPDQ